MKTKLIHILALLLLAGLVSAQISGNIIDAETKQGLSGVEVIELSSGETTLTNSKAANIFTGFHDAARINAAKTNYRVPQSW